ncbi:serine hydrolase domain-containing protein [Paraburkholderia tropica]|uniref:serine hydrolase domain-containing protein n=1 Tax=Paraburkholderia tropica TaxID=92647 RepID=UPI0007EC3E1F|nr:serine hydrolase [Paraburkholderia tropica]OBR54817.1 hypothetical protein A6456_35910 [Paraburkholderia tropica]
MPNPVFDPVALTKQAYEAARTEPPRTWRDHGLMEGFPPAPAARVKRSNFMRAPYNRWAFQNIDRLLPTVTVRAPRSLRPLEVRSTNALGNFALRSMSGEEVPLAEHLTATCTDGFLVMVDGSVRHEYYANGHSAEQRHIMFSVTKSLIGTLAQAAVDSGRLDDTRLAGDYVPQLRGSAFGDATVRHLLDMAVGIDYREDYTDASSESSQFGYACGLHPGPLAEGAPLPPEYEGLDSLYTFLPRLRKRGEHGGFFHYVTATTEALAWVIECATGESCHVQLERIWQAIGCERDGYFIADPLGRNVAGAGYNATLRDIARFGQMLLDHGKVDGQQVLPSDVVDSLLAGGSVEEFARNEEFAPFHGLSYRSQWYVRNGEALVALGVHGQMLVVDFTSRVVIVKQSSTPEAIEILGIDTWLAVQQIAQHFARA